MQQPSPNQSFVYDGDQLSMTFGDAIAGVPSGSSVLQHRYLDGPNGQVLADEAFNAAGQSTDTLWLLGDHEGTIRDVVDAGGALRQHLDYDSFGNVIGFQGYGAAVDELFGFAGQEFDPVTGLSNARARWYSPSMARFLSEDPGGVTGDVHPNPFEYAGNDPIDNTDPTGLSLVSPIVSLAKSAGNSLFGGLASGFSNLGSTIASTDFYQSASSYANTVFDVGRNVLSASPSALGEFTVAVGQYTSYNDQISQLQARPIVAPPRFYNQAVQYHNQGIAQLTAQRGDAYGNAENLLENIAYGAERVDIGFHPNGTPVIGAGDVFRYNGGYWHGVGEVGKGYGDAVVGTAQGIYNVGRHPINTAAGIGSAILHPILTGQAILNDIYDKSQTLRGQGNIVGDILTGIATGGVLKAAKEAGLVGKLTGRLGTLFEDAPTNIRANKLAGDAIRDAIAAREAPALTEQTLKTVGGLRRIDVVHLGDELVGIESKVGRTALTPHVRQELARDWWLKRQGQLDRIIWEFTPSKVTGVGGPTKPLFDKLNKLGIEVRINR